MTHRCSTCGSDNCSCVAQCPIKGHTWTNWSTSSIHSNINNRRCLECGKIEREEKQSKSADKECSAKECGNRIPPAEELCKSCSTAMQQRYEERVKQLLGDLEFKVYNAALILEDMERYGLIHGNGHHMAQKVAKFAVDLAKERMRK